MKWTPEQEQSLRDYYAGDTPVSAIAKLMRRSKNSIYCKAASLGISDVERAQIHAYRRDRQQIYQAAYRRGVEARRKQHGAAPPSRYAPDERAWWLAGWHDKDMELGFRVVEVAA